MAQREICHASIKIVANLWQICCKFGFQCDPDGPFDRSNCSICPHSFLPALIHSFRYTPPNMTPHSDKSDTSNLSPSHDHHSFQPATPTSRYSCSSPTSIDSRQHDPAATDHPATPARSATATKPSLANTLCAQSESSTTNCSRSHMIQVSPCSRCIDLARIFFDSLHGDTSAPLTMPAWLTKHKSFEAVVFTTMARTNSHDDDTDSLGLCDALIFAACGCFALVEAGTTKTCCNFPLIRTMLSLPATNPMRRRVRNLVLEVVSRTSEFSDKLVLRDCSSGAILLDYIINALHTFFTCHLIEKFSRKIESPSTVPIKTHQDERSEVMTCFQILTNLARQDRNHDVLLANQPLMRVCVMTASHPLADAQVLSISLLFISLMCATGDFIPIGAAQVVPGNLLVQSVLSVMELFTDGLISCLVCPMYVPEKPSKQFLASVCAIGLAYAQNARDMCNDETTHRLLNVVVTALLNESGSVFDMAHMAQIAGALAFRDPKYVMSRDGRFVMALLCMVQHVWAGQVARQTLRKLVQTFPGVRLFGEDVMTLLNETRHLDNNNGMFLSCAE